MLIYVKQLRNCVIAYTISSVLHDAGMLLGS